MFARQADMLRSPSPRIIKIGPFYFFKFPWKKFINSFSTKNQQIFRYSLTSVNSTLMFTTHKLNRPKRPANPYLLFLRETKDIIKKERPNCQIKELVKEIAIRWKNLPLQEKKDYFDKYIPEKEKYREEMKTLKEKRQLLKEEVAQGLRTDIPPEFFQFKRKRGRPRKNPLSRLQEIQAMREMQQMGPSSMMKVKAMNMDIDDFFPRGSGKKQRMEVKGTVSLDLRMMPNFDFNY